MKTTLLHRQAGLAVYDFACSARRGDVGVDEATTADLLVLPWRGHFEWRSGARVAAAGPTNGLWCRRGHGYRVAHPVCGGDRCTVIAFGPRPERSAGGAAVRSLSISAAVYRQHRWLRRLLQDGATPLQVDEAVAGLMHELGGAIDQAEPALASNQERRVRRALALLHEDPVRSWRLAELAALVGCSPFHLARSFRAVVGMPLHQCQLQLRLRLAFEAIADGCQDLAALALRVGFCEHAHLTRAFRRAFSESPRELRLRLRVSGAGSHARLGVGSRIGLHAGKTRFAEGVVLE